MIERRSIQEQYEASKRSLHRCEREVRAIIAGLLGEMRNAHLIRAQLRESRVKPLSSIQRKARKNGWSEADAIRKATDLVGFLIVCNNLEDIERIKDLILSSPRFHLVDEEPIQDFLHSPQPSGYRALHLNVTYEVTGPQPVSVACEIQIRTLAQDMWARLAHYDLYKHAESVPPHILKSSQRLASLLAVADEIAQDIREQVSQPLAGIQGADDELSPQALAFIHRRAFGADPPDYLVRTVLSGCEEVSCFRLDAIDRVLRDDATRSAVAQAYQEAGRWALSDETWFQLSPVVAVLGLEEATRRAAQLGREQRDEIEAIYRREVVAELPETFEELTQTFGAWGPDGFPSDVYDIAEVMGALEECAICGAPIINVARLVEALLEHFGVDEDPDGEIQATLVNCGLEVGDVDNPRLCSYHGWVLSKD